MTGLQIRRLVWDGLIALSGAFAFFAITVALALAHGGATLTVTPAEVAPGGIVTVKGDGVAAGETFTISLQGPQLNLILGTVYVTQETFEQGFAVPTNVPADVYQVRAVGEDGDTLTAELTVSAGAVAAQQPESTVPTAELMRLDRSKPPLQLVVIAGAVVLSVALGIWLLRPRRQPEKRD